MKSSIILFKWIIFYFCCAVTTSLFALEQHNKLWLAFDTKHPFTRHKKWWYQFYSQTRFINEQPPLQALILEGGLGYSLMTYHTVWLGFRMTENNPQKNAYQSYRVLQQWYWEIKKEKPFAITLRSRLEETKESNQRKISLLLRERLTGEIKVFYFYKIHPYFYEEVFFPLNKTNYIAHTVVSQNRLFMGARYSFDKKRLLEVGYINQYQIKTPLSNQNQMDHIISVTYYF